jgi:hypothetical protein
MPKEMIRRLKREKMDLETQGQPPEENNKRRQINMIRKQIQTRKKFSFNFFDVLKYFLCCFAVAKKEHMKSFETFRKYILFKKGKAKMLDELDAATLMKSVRNLKTMSQIIFNRHQKLLLKF